MWGMGFRVGPHWPSMVFNPASGAAVPGNGSYLEKQHFGTFPCPVPLCTWSVTVFLLLAGCGRSHPSARAGSKREPSPSRRPQCPAGPHHLQPELPAGNRHPQDGHFRNRQLTVCPLSLRKGAYLCRPHSLGYVFV